MSTIIPVVTGPTASGKTAFVIDMIERGYPLEIISADAFQVYRGLDIGTAKASKDLREKIPHHLVDIQPPDGSYNAGDFVEHAEATIAEVLSRGKLPVVTGGTGMYISSLIYGMFEAPAMEPQLRETLQQRLKENGRDAMYAELAELDPEGAARLNPNDYVRVIRALEVYHTTGISIVTAWEKYRSMPKYSYKVMVVATERQALYEEINRRVLKMVDEGWLAEVEALLAEGITEEASSFKGLGYRELAAVVKGEMDIDTAIQTISRKTRNYAKRQNTWFRGMPDATFMEFNDMEKEICHLLNPEG